MAEWLALAEVAARPLAGRGFSVHPQGGLDHAGFRVQAAGWRAAFAGQPGHRVAMYFEDAATFAAALFGAWHAGKTPVLCMDALPRTCDELGATVDAFAGDFPDAFSPLAMQAVDDDGGQWPALDEAATRLVVYTSGSTGEACAIAKTLAKLAREVEALEATFGAAIGVAQVHGTVSHQHIYGLLFRVLWPLAAGRVMAPRLFFHEEIADAIGVPALLVTSPAHLKRIPGNVDFSRARHCLRAVFSSGGALLPQAAEATADRMGRAPIEILGSSETGGIAWRQVPTGAWTPLPGVQWRIVEGQLEVASPHLPDPDWFRTADRAQARGEGEFDLLGRADRIVKVEERRVSLGALERSLAALPEVAEVRVVLLDGARAELAAVVCPSASGLVHLRQEGRRGLAHRLRSGLVDAQEAVTRPRRWRFVDALPTNAQGKTTDAALHALFRPARPTPRWLAREQTSACLELDLAEDLLVFDGHFPQVPILPGVAQLDWAIRFGREAFTLPARFVRMEAVKFQKVARPGMCLRLQLEWMSHKSALAFRYESRLGPHASGRAVFAAVDEAGVAG